MFAVKHRFFVGPDRFDSAYLLLKFLKAARPLNAVVFGFFAIPASANTEDRATVGKDIECGNRFCRGDGVAFDQ